MESEEAKLIQIYKRLVKKLERATRIEQCLEIIVEVNGGNSTNPAVLFDNKTGKLKTFRQLYKLAEKCLFLIFKSNTLNSENSKLLIFNSKIYKKQKWGLASGRKKVVQDSSDCRWRLRKLRNDVSLSDFFNLDFSLKPKN